MPTYKQFITAMSIVMTIGITMPVFAESAPVYDADQMPQQFDGNNDQGQSADRNQNTFQDQDLPPAPEGGAFVPVPNPSASSSSVTTSAEPVSAQSMTMTQRMRRMEQLLSNMQANDANARIDSLQAQVQNLRGQVEQLTHQLQQADAQQKTWYADVDKRLSQQPSAVKPKALDTSTDAVTPAVAEVGTSPAEAKTKAQKAKAAKLEAAAKVAANQPNVAEEQQIYQTAYNMIKSKRYAEAVIALQGMLKKYPSGQFASNAHYWLGELYGLMGKNDQALTEFGTVVKTFPDSPRVSDAQLKVGLLFASQEKWSDAKASFKKVINHYPGTASARLAAEQLKQIKLAGH